VVVGLEQKKPYQLLECGEIGLSWVVGVCGTEEEDGKGQQGGQIVPALAITTCVSTARTGPIYSALPRALPLWQAATKVRKATPAFKCFQEI
jgi:hypothetical protein